MIPNNFMWSEGVLSKIRKLTNINILGSIPKSGEIFLIFNN